MRRAARFIADAAAIALLASFTLILFATSVALTVAMAPLGAASGALRPSARRGATPAG